MISLLAAAAALSPKLVSLHDFSFGCRCPSLSPFMISLLAAAAALSPKLVSLHDFALGCRCRLVCSSLSPFMISLLAAAAALSPKLMIFPQIARSFRGSYFSMDGFLIAEIGCRCRLVSQACLPS